MNSSSTGTDSDGDSYSDSYGQLLWKLLKFHLIGTDICVKLGTVAIGIGIGITHRFSGNSSAHYHWTQFHRNRNRNQYRNRNRAVETHHQGGRRPGGQNDWHTPVKTLSCLNCCCLRRWRWPMWSMPVNTGFVCWSTWTVERKPFSATTMLHCVYSWACISAKKATRRNAVSSPNKEKKRSLHTLKF